MLYENYYTIPWYYSNIQKHLGDISPNWFHTFNFSNISLALHDLYNKSVELFEKVETLQKLSLNAKFEFDKHYYFGNAERNLYIPQSEIRHNSYTLL